MFGYQGKTALITGASSGIGEAFARSLAARGMSLLLVARSQQRLEQLAAELASEHGIHAEAIAADLSDSTARDAILGQLRARGTHIDMLVNNAGIGLHGSFDTLPADLQQEEIQLNIGAVVAMAQMVLPDMLARSSGTIINVASTLGLQPVPYMAVYGATKAFVLSFTHALAEEYRGRGITFLALCPGATATAFYSVSGGKDVFARMRMRTAPQVVATALRALEHGQRVAIDGPFNRLLFGMTGALPAAVGARMLGRALHPR